MKTRMKMRRSTMTKVHKLTEFELALLFADDLTPYLRGDKNWIERLMS